MKKLFFLIVFLLASALVFSQNNSTVNLPVFTAEPTVIKTENASAKKREKIIFTAMPAQIQPEKKNNGEANAKTTSVQFSAEPARIPSGKKTAEGKSK